MKDKQQTGYGKYGNKNWRMLWRAVTVVYTMYTMKMMRNITAKVDMDEDDAARLMQGHYKECPYYQLDDEYAVVRHQM